MKNTDCITLNEAMSNNTLEKEFPNLPGGCESDQHSLNLGSPCADSPASRGANISERDYCPDKINVALLGTSNCRYVNIPSDADLTIDVSSVIVGGLKIKGANSKLCTVEPEKLKSLHAVVLHVGSTDFQVNSQEEFDGKYMEYVEEVVAISGKCPKATILMSSIPPRKGDLNSRINRQIRLFNAKLLALAQNEPNLVHIDNDAHLTESGQTVNYMYKVHDENNIHLNKRGKQSLANQFQKAIKDAHYRNKLDAEFDIVV